MPQARSAEIRHLGMEHIFLTYGDFQDLDVPRHMFMDQLPRYKAPLGHRFLHLDKATSLEANLGLIPIVRVIDRSPLRMIRDRVE